MTGSWLAGWATDDYVSAAEFAKGAGCIFDSTLSGSAASFDITGIPAGYAHLMLIIYGRSTGGTIDQVAARFNNDSGSNYNDQGGINHSSIQSGASFSGAGMPANFFSAGRMFIPHYAGTSNYKSVEGWIDGFDNGLSGSHSYTTSYWNGLWKNANAINRLTVFPLGGSFAAGSRCSLYVLGA